MGNFSADELAARVWQRRERWTIFLFAWASLGAVIAGALAMGAAQRSSPFWLRDLIAWVAGALMAWAVVSLGFSKLLKRLLLGVALAGLASSLLNQGISGVHRWLDFGPLHINIASLLLPALLIVLAADVLGPNFSAAVAAAVIVVLWAQPDASQASAFAAAFAVLCGVRGFRPVTQRLFLLVVLLGAGLSWIRANPLSPVPEVEGAVGLAWHYSPVIASIAVVCLVIAAMCPLLLTIGNRPIRIAGIALTTYFAVTAIAPFVGYYPVPLIGVGMSPIVGFWIGFGCLIALQRKSAAMPVRHRLENNALNPLTPDRRDFAVG